MRQDRTAHTVSYYPDSVIDVRLHAKPLACSSPVVQRQGSRLFRVHDGFRVGPYYQINPSKLEIYE